MDFGGILPDDPKPSLCVDRSEWFEDDSVAGRPTKAQRREAERRLARYGLAAHQLRSQQDIQPVVKPVHEDNEQTGIQDHQFDRGLDGPWQSDARGVILDGSDLDRHHVVRTREHERLIPAWTKDDAQVRQVLLSSFPGLATDPKQRAGAGRWWRILYQYFRLNEWTKTIAEEMGITVRAVESVVARARKLGAALEQKPVSSAVDSCEDTNWPIAA